MAMKKKPETQKSNAKKSSASAAAKKPVAKPPAAKKAAAKKPVAKKPAAKKPPEKKLAAKKPAAKKPPEKKLAAKKPAAKKPAAKKPAEKKPAAKLVKVKRQPSAAFMKPVQPDAALAAVVGSAPLPRTELIKQLWAYIKKKGLQDPKEKQMINADESLDAVFGGKKKVSMFEMTKLVGQHVNKG